LGFINISKTSIRLIIVICRASPSIENILNCIRRKRRDRNVISKGYFHKCDEIFCLGTVFKNSKAVYWLFDFEKWKNLFDGDLNYGSSILKTD
jgi:hypothetical protein